MSDKRDELIKEFKSQFVNSEKPAWEVYADITIQREQAIRDEHRKVLENILRDTGGCNNLDEVFVVINAELEKGNFDLKNGKSK